METSMPPRCGSQKLKRRDSLGHWKYSGISSEIEKLVHSELTKMDTGAQVTPIVRLGEVAVTTVWSRLLSKRRECNLEFFTQNTLTIVPDRAEHPECLFPR
ncbi:hypothetical protein DY000_02046207 [Brassica cretica]|uniref:Uncharacterized protein n=1 Tax=Brassica cretica TaxID=69181 RepID=A0ABQ7F4Z4_BRACR|nr:hypothetical protein DY000_02046207 [Brassica cretica]